jgi:hypothetical protein
MPVSDALTSFKDSLAQCDSLIANAHKTDNTGAPFLSPIDRGQVTVAAFLNMFVAWEGFLEEAVISIMSGAATINGKFPNKYVSPLSVQHAREMIVGTMKYFDYANHENVRKIVQVYFDRGQPFEPHLGSMFSELEDLRTMRNSSTHISSSTQQKLESLAGRIFGLPKIGISLYELLTSPDPRSKTGETIFLSYKNKLVVAAELIANG